MLDGESMGHLPHRGAWTVCLGPGPELEELAPVLGHLGRRVGAGDPVGPPLQVTVIGDVAELLGEVSGAGRLVLSGDGFPEEDIGFVRRFLANHPAWELVLVGRDPGARVSRVLLGLPRARWLQLPPDLDQLRELARSPGARAPASAPAQAQAPVPAPVPAAAAAALPIPDAPVPLGDYVGTLADLVQRVDLSLGLAREDVAARGLDLDPAADEVGDLRQMTHRLKRVAAPPERGGETFDVGELFEERLASITIQSPRELRFLPRGERGHLVRADRAVVAEAIASMLALARGCASPDGVVRAPYGPTGSGAVRLGLEFPAGPLERAEVSELLRPGGLAYRVPGLGAADLPAALAVARSQGGDLRLEREPNGRLRAELELPLA